MTTLPSLRRAIQSANDAHDAIVSERDDKIRQLHEQIHQRITAEYEDQLYVLSVRLAEAQAAYDAEASRVASSGKDAPIPLGTKCIEWKGGGWACRSLHPTGRIGVIEAVTTETQHPGNNSSRARPGEFILRILKKDGTPSKQYERLIRGELPFRWYREGVDPNAKEKRK